MSFLRLALRLAPRPLRFSACQNVGFSLATISRQQNPRRTYASKNAKSTATLVPGSKQPITDEAAKEEYTKAEASMQTSVEWYRKECSAVEARASGRVTPALLSSVRVKLPGSNTDARLEEVATVGVRDGSALLITIFEEDVRFYHCLPTFLKAVLCHLARLILLGRP
jgi:ribosome recycling factor